MKTARFLLAIAAASVLAACGSDTITAPAASARAPRADITSGDTTGTSYSVGGTCIVVTTVNSDGSTTTTCSSTDNTIQIGTGH